ncbi:MAG: hypothetical protein GDA68_02920 [Nitrospira sp. CR2.1]|nr:hypothetical protein [Nitrospira sp. CR2.1]
MLGGNKDDGKDTLAAALQEIDTEAERESDEGEVKQDEAEAIKNKVNQDHSDVIEISSVHPVGLSWEFEYVQRVKYRTSRFSEKDKPKYAPSIEKWEKKGGEISVSANGTWTYTDWEGNSVPYRNGFPVFPKRFIRQEVDIDMDCNHTTDFTKANNEAPLGKKLPENTWHHHENLKTMQEIPTEIHDRFKHRGGVSVCMEA